MNKIDRWAEGLHAAIGGRETDKPEEVAEIVVRYLTNPVRPYDLPGLPSLVLSWLAQWEAERDEGAATMAAECTDPEEVF